MERSKQSIRPGLPKSRQEEIQTLMRDDFQSWRASCGEIWQSDVAGSARRVEVDHRKPSWETFATTNPVVVDGKRVGNGVRGCIAFCKSPCAFKIQTRGTGCSHCALSIGNKSFSAVRPEDQIAAVENAIAGITKSLGYTPPVVELLPDGSFLHEEEVSAEALAGIFKVLSKNDSVLRIAIESRPEYITAQKIRDLLKLIRDDQSLEIYIGLESIDPFVLDKIIGKGFTVDQFEKKMKEISDELSAEEKRRLNFSLYHFFKPPYLTEKESIDAAIAMGEKVKEYGAKTGMHFSVKYEPAVISDGTFQKYLFDREKFTPPSYFSIAEVVALAERHGFSNLIKFGQRDDIDDFQTVAAIPDINNPRMFSPFDFMVYNAVQRFNADQDIFGFCADMEVVIENSPEFKKWEVSAYGGIGGSALSQLFAEFKKSEHDGDYKDRVVFQKDLWKVLDQIEYNHELSKQVSSQGKECPSGIEAKLISLFLQANIKVLQIKGIKFFDIGRITNAPKLQNCHPDFADATQEAVYQIEVVIENEARLPQSVWAKIPLNPIDIDLGKFDFIYG
jgi:radical SAM enzyme (TIGR01210 family)